MSVSLEPTLHEEALAALRKKGNPFRQQFARNSDDSVCTLYHVDELFARERAILQTMIEQYRSAPTRATSVLPLLGARGAGKTHLLHWLKHGPGVAPQLFVTPGTFRVDVSGPESSFLEYFLYQLIHVLLAGGEQRGLRPIVYVGEQITRRLVTEAIAVLDERARLDLLQLSNIRKLGYRLGVGVRDSLGAIDAFLTDLANRPEGARVLAQQADIDPERLFQVASGFLKQKETRDLNGEFRKRILNGFLRATLLADESELADFLTDGFMDVPYVVRPTRGQMTLSLVQSLTAAVVDAGIPIAVAFDQLEELLYGQTDDEIRRSSDAFFGGIVQLMSQVTGLAVLLFVEEGLWNRIVPPLPSHILDRIHEPIHLPDFGTIRNVRLSAPTLEQLTQVVACRVSRTLGDFHDLQNLPLEFPFDQAFLQSLAKRETVLRLMLQGCCNRLDELFENPTQVKPAPRPTASYSTNVKSSASLSETSAEPNRDGAAKDGAAIEGDEIGHLGKASGWDELKDRWSQEVRGALRKLKPVGALSAAVAELQGGLAHWLQLCKALGVEQGDWRMSEVVDQILVGDHPTYGSLTIVEWTNNDTKRRVGVGLWLGRGVGKPRDLDTKLSVFQSRAVPLDHLILLRPEDDARLSGKTMTSLNQATEAGHSVRVESADLDVFAKIQAFPRWMRQVVDFYGEQGIPEAVYVFLAEQTESIMQKLGLPQEGPAV